MEKLKIGIADDHNIFRQGIALMLGRYSHLEIVINEDSGFGMLDKVKSGIKPDICILDIEMPVLNGIETLKEIQKLDVNAKVIILSMHEEDAVIANLIELGARGFISKTSDFETILNAIYSVNSTGYYFNDKISKALVKQLISTNKVKPKFSDIELNSKEEEIIRLIVKEYTNQEIGDKLFLSKRTIDNYRNDILKKIGARNTAGIVMYAVKMGWI